MDNQNARREFTIEELEQYHLSARERLELLEAQGKEASLNEDSEIDIKLLKELIILIESLLKLINGEGHEQSLPFKDGEVTEKSALHVEIAKILKALKVKL
jgi:hypothetical protein